VHAIKTMNCQVFDCKPKRILFSGGPFLFLILFLFLIFLCDWFLGAKVEFSLRPRKGQGASRWWIPFSLSIQQYSNDTHAESKLFDIVGRLIQEAEERLDESSVEEVLAGIPLEKIGPSSDGQIGGNRRGIERTAAGHHLRESRKVSIFFSDQIKG
jgi:hypothetical protein